MYGKLFKNINELTMNVDVFNNTEENYLFFELVTTYQYKNHMNLIGVLDRNLLNINSPATFKEYYTFDVHNNIFAGINRISDEEALLIIEHLLSSFEEVLKSDYFTKEEKNITLDGKQLNLISNNFIINESNIKEIVPKVMKVLKNDVEFINAFAKYKNIDGVDFKGELNKIEESINSINNDEPIDIVELELKQAWDKLGEIIGETYTDELLDELFSRFCLGK